MKNSLLHNLLILFALIYVISPADAMPGPLDDLIILIMTHFINKKANRIE